MYSGDIQNSEWKILWPEYVAERDFEGLEPDVCALMDEDVSVAKIMEFEVESVDVHELLKNRENELSTKERQLLQEEQQRTLVDDLSSDEDEVRESAPSSLVKEMCAKWWVEQLFV